MSSINRRNNSSKVFGLAFQLLFFFVALPHTFAAEEQKPNIDPVPRKQKESVKIEVFSEDGEIKNFDVTSNAANGAIPNLNGLMKTLGKIKNKDKVPVTLEVPVDLKYAKLVDLLDDLQKAGFKDVNVSIKRKP